MYLHLGNNYTVKKSSVVLICDIDKTTCSKNTRIFLEKSEKGKEIKVCTDDIPRSFVLIRENGKNEVYLSGINPQTLQKRIRQPFAAGNITD
ncbi:MAG: DUF370 domain-containing protein [Ruminococcaceae bacterium]|nr:DUF370 domain-containing protein [Oscillospiraceae bacterium]